MSVAKFVWKYLKKVKFFFFISFALYLLSFSTSRINVYISAQLIEMISKFDGDNIIKIEWILMLSAFVVTSLTGSIFLYAAHIIDACYMPKLRSFFEKDMFEHVYKHSLQFFDEEKSGNIDKAF